MSSLSRRKDADKIHDVAMASAPLLHHDCATGPRKHNAIFIQFRSAANYCFLVVVSLPYFDIRVRWSELLILTRCLPLEKGASQRANLHSPMLCRGMTRGGCAIKCSHWPLFQMLLDCAHTHWPRLCTVYCGGGATVDVEKELAKSCNCKVIELFSEEKDSRIFHLQIITIELSNKSLKPFNQLLNDN